MSSRIRAALRCGAAVLALSGTYSELLDYVIFAQLLFYVLTVAAVFVLRRRLPDAPRPYRAWGYPWVPGIFVAGALALTINILLQRPGRSSAGLLLIAAGLPFYRFWKKSASGSLERRRSGNGKS